MGLTPKQIFGEIKEEMKKQRNCNHFVFKSDCPFCEENRKWQIKYILYPFYIFIIILMIGIIKGMVR